MALDFEAAEVQEEEEEEEQGKEEKEADVEEQERVDALLQRKKLLQDLGVVDQIRQLLQGLTDRGGVLQDACSQQQRHQPHQKQQTRVRTIKCVINSQHQHTNNLWKIRAFVISVFTCWLSVK